MSLDSAAPPRILIIRRRYIGDLVLLGPFLRNLHRHWPAAHITVLVNEGYADILALNPDVDCVLQIPHRRHHRLRREIALLRGLRLVRFTHVFDLDTNDRTAFLTWLTGAPFRASFEPDRHRRCRRLAYTHLTAVAPCTYFAESIIEHTLRLLPLAGVPVATRECSLEPRPEDLRRVATLLPERRGPRVLLHPGSRSSYRIWPLDRFARVADRLQTELGAQVILAGGPSEQALIDGIRAAARTPLAVLPPSVDLGAFAACVRQVDVFLCHDSGPMHIAAAVGTRVVALFGSQSKTVWAPAGDGHHVLQAPLPCTGCLWPQECDPANGYRNYCVRRIGEDEVFSAVCTVLASLRAIRE
jgi:predicted lipopolysaccharide heptosyltransferase III